MRICRFSTASQPKPRWALIDGEILIVLLDAPFAQVRAGKGRVPLEEARLLAPTQPSKIVCVGLNDRVHADEMSKTLPAEPRIFIKPSTAVIGPEQPIVLPDHSSQVEHEAELGVVMARDCYHLRPEEAWSAVLGYTCVNDVTARDLQRRDGHYTRAKGYDTFCPLGPVIVTDVHPAPVRIEARVNGQLRQQGHSKNLIRDVPTLLSYITSIMTLRAGDVVATGTYGGTAPLAAGDEVEVEIERVGLLKNPVIAAPTTGVFGHLR